MIHLLYGKFSSLLRDLLPKGVASRNVVDRVSKKKLSVNHLQKVNNFDKGTQKVSY